MLAKYLRRLCLGLVFVLGCAVFIEAAYLRNIPVNVKQPDGAVLSCLASGDEFYNWLHDKDNYTIVRNAATGFLVYADKVDGKLVPTEFIAGRTDVRTLEQAGIQKKLLDDPTPREKRVSAAQDEPIVNTPQTGTINNLVVYIRFSDQAEFGETFVTNTATFFNSTTPGVSSFRNYFTEVSYSQLTIGSTFYPGSTPGVFSYQDANPRAYYMPYDATTNPGGYNGESVRATREHALLRNAVNAISAEVPAGLNIDADADGYVDNICFVVKGEPTAWATLLWPHKWALYTLPYAYINGKQVWTYNFQLETSLNVGILCHEMFHSLGAPDLYHNNNGSYSYLEPVWAWDLMEWNLDPPEHMGAYMKCKYGTWIPFIPEITTSGTYTLHPLTSATNNCYRIPSPSSSTEYFVVEYRKMTGGGTFEGNLWNEGLLVYRINTAYTGNFNGPPDEVYIYRPDGTPSANGSPWLAPFSSQQGRTEINDGTNPASFLTDGTAGGLSISNVGLYGDTISFDVSIGTITVTSPNGGETWIAGDNATVTWMSTGNIGMVDILLTTDWGEHWTTLVDNTANDGSQTITVPLVSNPSCFIAVVESVYWTPYDISDASFSIIMNPSSVTVTSPNGGETWLTGSSRDVTWTWTGTIGNVAIDYSINGGVNWQTAIASTPNTGSFAWTIPGAPSASCLVRVSDASNGTISDTSNALFSIVNAPVHDLLATWDGQGVYYRNSNTGGWVKLASPATMIACGDLDGDAIDDIVGLWPTQGGIWVKYSQSGAWARLSSTAVHIAAGDMNGDGRVDLLGTWDGQGVYYRNSLSGAWVKLASPATMITTGDLDGDGTDDLIGIWPTQGGVWVKYSQSGAWARLSSTARDIAAGDMNGDGRDDLIATWDGQGAYYRNSQNGAWVKMASEATQVTCGDLDGDAKSDLIGIWPTQGGVWVKYSHNSAWAMLGSTARDISAGKMRASGPPSPALIVEMPQPLGGFAEGPEAAPDMKALSDDGPGGKLFRPRVEKNMTPLENRSLGRGLRTPGPGEPGFRCVEQKNMHPGEARAGERPGTSRKKVKK
jgi:M6 family metalloprotease-like protein